MTKISKNAALLPVANVTTEQRRFIALVGKAAGADLLPFDQGTPIAGRVFRLDADFESAGAWSGVADLVEAAYLGLRDLGQDAALEQYSYELQSVLLNHRDSIHPKHLCLTDTATGTEKTRFYPLDRAYRTVHGLAGLVLHWKRALAEQARWLVVVRNFDHAQHLAARFFAELARRAARADGIDIVIETRLGGAEIERRAPGMRAVPAALRFAESETEPKGRRELDAVAASAIEQQIAEGDDILLEQNHAALLAQYRARGDGLAVARIALKMLCAYNRRGYYHEAACFIDAILPHFSVLVGSDENRRMLYVSELNSCLVMIGDQARSLRLITELAAPYLTKPDLLANVNYILAMHHLRFAKVTDTALAEQHILLAVEQIGPVKDAPGCHEARFQKVFIDNGLAFLRVRQGRHQEALDLCQSGYDSLTEEVGEDRHLLHRSVLQYNTAQVYVMIGRPEEGLEHYKKSIEMDPHYSEYHNESGNILQKLDRHDEAIEYYERAIAYGAPYPEVYFNKGVCHARQGDWEAALACFEISLDLNPSQPEIHALRAELFEALERADDALAEYDSALALAPDIVAARVNRAVLHFNSGAYVLALADMDHVIALEPEEPSHYENRAAIYEAMGREDLHAGDLATAQRCSEAA